MGLEFHTPKTLCEEWPQGCQFCDLILCDGKKENATIKITQRDFHTCAHGCEESVCLWQHEKYGNCNMYSEKSKQTNADRIRAMTDEELAEWFHRIQYDVSDYYCGGHSCEPTLPTGKESWLGWLKQEASNGED